jgi:hypothetical protein
MLQEVTPDYDNENLSRAFPMTVGTLIQKLQTCNPNKPVRLVVDGFNLMDMPSFGVSEGEDDVTLGRYDDMAFLCIDDMI